MSRHTSVGTSLEVALACNTAIGHDAFEKRERMMDTVVGVLAIAGGFGLGIGLTVLGMSAVLALMPNRRQS